MEDSVRLFDEDRQRFVELYLDFLKNPEVPSVVRLARARATESVIRQIGALLGLADG